MMILILSWKLWNMTILRIRIINVVIRSFIGTEFCYIYAEFVLIKHLFVCLHHDMMGAFY